MSNIDYTRKLYDKFAEAYHQKRLSVKDSLWNRFIEMPAMTTLVRPIVKNKKVLDLGCGSGIFTKNIQSWGANVTGCDLSKNLTAIAKKENPKIQFIVCNGEKTPFKNSEFDVVTSGLMVHYLKDLKPLFKEVFRITKKNGVFIFSMQHPFGEGYEQKIINGKTYFVLKPYFNNDKFEWMMLKDMKRITYHHTLENVFTVLTDCGFIVEKLIETKPSKELKKYDSTVYDIASKYPSFLVLKIRKAL